MQQTAGPSCERASLSIHADLHYLGHTDLPWHKPVEAINVAKLEDQVGI